VKTRELQRLLNRFTRHELKHITPLRVDGQRGPATCKRVQMIKYYLGFQKKRRTGKQACTIDKEFLSRVRHPDNPKSFNSREAYKRSVKRRRWQRAHAKPPKAKVASRYGIGTFDGKPVANAAIPYLQWARQHGWHGRLVSGWRSRAYSQHLCYAMCGRPQCPGRCAGMATNHVYSQPDRFAIDVSDYGTFGRLMQRYPGRKIRNSLGSRDPVHFSPSGT